MLLLPEDFPSAPCLCQLSEHKIPVDWERIIFDICPGCHENMSSIPQGVFAARKVHSNMEKMKLDMAENPPAKYNGKLMNSIWGLYNRYSVHNLKKITDANNSVEAGKNTFSQYLIASE